MTPSWIAETTLDGRSGSQIGERLAEELHLMRSGLIAVALARSTGLGQGSIPAAEVALADLASSLGTPHPQPGGTPIRHIAPRARRSLMLLDTRSEMALHSDPADATLLLALDPGDVVHTLAPLPRPTDFPSEMAWAEFVCRIRHCSDDSFYQVKECDGGGSLMHFVPWLHREACPDMAECGARILIEWCLERAIQIRLAEGDLLVLRNSQVLHARSAISPASTRLILRSWVSVDAWPDSDLLSRTTRP